MWPPLPIAVSCPVTLLPTFILHCWALLTLCTVPEKPRFMGEKMPLPSHPVSWHNLSFLGQLRAGPPLTICRYKPLRQRCCSTVGDSGSGVGSESRPLVISSPPSAPTSPVLVIMLAGLTDIITSFHHLRTRPVCSCPIKCPLYRR